MPRLQLTDVTVRALKSDAQTDFWDTKTPGFGVRVGKNSKTFVVKVANRRITLGKYPDLSLSEARKQALGRKSETSSPGTIRFSRAVDLFIENYCKPNNRPRVSQERERILHKHFVSEFANQRLTTRYLTHYASNSIETFAPFPVSRLPAIIESPQSLLCPSTIRVPTLSKNI